MAIFNLEYIRELSEDKLSKLIDLTRKLAGFEYTCYSKDKENLGNSRKVYDDHYTLSASEFAKLQGGICYDYVNYEATQLSGYKWKAFFFGDVLDNGQVDGSHTYILIYLDNKVYWIESSWKSNMGVYEFENEDNALSYITNKLKRHKGYFTVEYKPSSSLVGLTLHEFINKMSDKPEYNYKELTNPKCKRIIRFFVDKNGKVSEK